MIIVPAELARKIDENRGDMSQAEFVEFLLSSHFGDKFEDGPLSSSSSQSSSSYVTREEFQSFEQDMKKLMKNFLDFFVTYGLEFGKTSFSHELDELTSKIQGIEKDSDSGGKRATIKWK
jgi:hypothetical protein